MGTVPGRGARLVLKGCTSKGERGEENGTENTERLCKASKNL